MRVLQLNTYYDKVGGAEVYLHLVIDALKARGDDVAVFGFSPDKEIREPRVRDQIRPEFTPSNLVRESELNEAFLEFVRDFDPELIHVHNLSAYPAEFPRVVSDLNVPTVQTVHDFSVLCPNSWCVLPSGEVCAGGPGAKCFEHGCQENYPYDGRVVTAAKLRFHNVRTAFEAYLCPSQFLADKLTANGFEHAEGLPLWVDLDSVPAEALEPVEKRDADHVLFLGRLVREKGVHVLVDSMPHVLKQRPNARLSVVGGGPELENLKAQAEKLGLSDSVTFHGKVPHEDVQKFFRSATLQVLPSIWCENSPVTTYESYISGLPMVASRIAGLPAMVREGETGLLATPRDAADLAEKIARILGDEALQKTLAEGCRASLERYARDVHLKRIYVVYDEIVERFASRPRPEPGMTADPDLLAALDVLFEDNAKQESWALGMKGHIDYLESQGEAGKPVKKFAQHLKFIAKSRVRKWREK